MTDSMSFPLGHSFFHSGMNYSIKQIVEYFCRTFLKDKWHRTCSCTRRSCLMSFSLLRNKMNKIYICSISFFPCEDNKRNISKTSFCLNVENDTLGQKISTQFNTGGLDFSFLLLSEEICDISSTFLSKMWLYIGWMPVLKFS